MNRNYINLAQAFYAQCSANKTRLVYKQFQHGSGKYSLLGRNYQEVASRVSVISYHLNKLGLKKGDKVAIISNTRPEWLEADLAVLSLGAVVVSVYPSLLDNELAYILWDSGARIVFAENQEQMDKLSRINRQNILMPACDDKPASTQSVEIASVVTFEKAESVLSTYYYEDLLEQNYAAQDDREFSVAEVGPQDLASIVYTSGTTGAPKGVLQTHGNHLANIRQAREGGLYHSDSSIYMMLPLAHSFAKLMGYIGFVGGVPLQFPSVSDRTNSKINQRQAILELSNSSCTIYPLVPRILEKLKDGIESKASKPHSVLRLAIKSGESDSHVSRIISLPVKKLLKKKLFGKNFKYVISGGAKLPADVNIFFSRLGIEVLEGYGLTETCVATNCNRIGRNKIGTVGPVLSPDIKIKIAEDGEILFSGPNIAVGYHNKPIATAKAWDTEGWFHTGDIGQLDEQGYLQITGRKKEIIVTAGGKKVVPEKIEAMLKANRLISQAVLVGEGRPYCVAIVSLNQEVQSTLQLEVSQIKQEIDQYIDSLNTQLASFESIKKVAVVRQEFSIENGFLTPTLKVKRVKVMEAYKQLIDELYLSSKKVLLS